jgi:hypothetical protein
MNENNKNNKENDEYTSERPYFCHGLSLRVREFVVVTEAEVSQAVT